MKALWRLWHRLDAAMIHVMDAYGIRILRISVAVVFIWFGALKLLGRSPVAGLVSGTVYWVDARWFVPVLGLWEVAVGVGLLLRIGLRLVLALFWVQLAGTFLTLIVRPDLSFQNGNPLLLTQTGEFVVKNLVLIAAGLIIGSTVQRRDELGRRA